jgi:NhaP-type Na+/H+ or K+/H+ antiporter
MLSMQQQIVYFAGILALGISAQWLAWRLRLPAILLLLAFGFLAGQFVDIDSILGKELLFPLVSLSVGIIMFEGGLSLQLRELRETGGVVFRLVTIAVLVTWVLGGLAAYWILDFEPRMAALLGAILVVSGPTVIIPLLRHVRPVGRIGAVVKWEGIVNDPVGAVLAVLVLEAIRIGRPGEAAVSTIYGLVATMGVGAFAGVVAATLLIVLLKRFLVPDFLHSPVILATVLVAFTVSNLMRHESGLVTTTVMGVILANQSLVAVKHIIEFKENLRVLLISTLFIVLAARVGTDELIAVAPEGLLFLAALVLLIRPLAVFAATVGSELNWRERLFLGWLAPRGIVAAAVSSLFALRLITDEGLSAGVYANAEVLEPLTFLVIVGTVTIYGLTSSPLARLLGISRQDPQGVLFAGSAPWIQDIAQAVKEEGFSVLLVDTNYPNIAAARMAGLPVCYASVLSEYLHEDQELSEIGRLLAMTPNEEVNSLATTEFAEQFGRSEVYQLPAPESKTDSVRRAPVYRRGRTLFGEEMNYAALGRRYFDGARTKRTGLTEDFNYEDYRAKHGDRAVVLFVVADGKLLVSTVDKPLEPEAGQTLIGLIQSPPDSAEEAPADSK